MERIKRAIFILFWEMIFFSLYMICGISLCVCIMNGKPEGQARRRDEAGVMGIVLCICAHAGKFSIRQMKI